MSDDDDWGWFQYGKCGGQTVVESEDRDKPKPTGVLNRNGTMIYRKPEPIGFKIQRLGKEPT